MLTPYMCVSGIKFQLQLSKTANSQCQVGMCTQLIGRCTLSILHPHKRSQLVFGNLSRAPEDVVTTALKFSIFLMYITPDNCLTAHRLH